LAKVLLRK